MRNRWTSKIVSILRRIWLLNLTLVPSDKVDPILKSCDWAFLMCGDNKGDYLGWRLKSKDRRGSDNNLSDIDQIFTKISLQYGEKNIWHKTHKPLPNILADNIYDTFEVMKYKHEMMFMNWPPKFMLCHFIVWWIRFCQTE